MLSPQRCHWCCCYLSISRIHAHTHNSNTNHKASSYFVYMMIYTYIWCMCIHMHAHRHACLHIFLLFNFTCCGCVAIASDAFYACHWHNLLWACCLCLFTFLRGFMLYKKSSVHIRMHMCCVRMHVFTLRTYEMTLWRQASHYLWRKHLRTCAHACVCTYECLHSRSY